MWLSMGEHHPEGIECDREKMREEEKWARSKSNKDNQYMAIIDSEEVTCPARRDTGPLTHSPPNSKYLKHPV
jgi:hypothetical protein